MMKTKILNYVIIVALVLALVLALAFLIYTILRKPKCNCTGALDQIPAHSYTSCSQYKSSSGCKKSKLNCQWDGSSCSSAGGDPTPPPPGPTPSGKGVSAWMGNNDWILQIKLGTGGANCTGKTAYSCHYLYASSTQPALQLITDTNVDSAVADNPAYRFYQTTQNRSNKWVSWNDGSGIRTAGGKSCPSGTSAKGAAHDKGTLVCNSGTTEGVYLQSSNPNWGCFNSGFTATCDDGNTPGIQTWYAQHLLFVKLNNSSDIGDLITLMNNSNLCATDGSGPAGTNPFPSFKPYTKSVLQGEYMNKTLSNGLIIYSKPNRDAGNQDDPWAYLNQQLCGGKGMYALTYCSPQCPSGSGGKKPIGGITDVLNTHAERGGDYSAMNTNCGLAFDAFKSNHSKLGVCIASGSQVVVGGNNHEPPSQGDRGGLFVVIDDSTLADDFRCLFK